jgi:uncharacterized RDD family membrane protein YckC
MAFLGLEISKAAPGYRKKRFAAFLIDVVIVLTIIFIVFSITGKPDFPSVKIAMDEAGKGASGANAQALGNVMFSLFNEAYFQSLIIWFAYEVFTQFVFSGATIGKLIMGLRIVPVNPARKWILKNLSLLGRSIIKFSFLYIFQGFPFFIAVLTIFANPQSRTGYDIFVRTYVKDTKGEIKQ